MPTLTVHIAEGGAAIAHEPNTNLAGTSSFGHMWYSVSTDGTAANEKSFGFAPDAAHNGQPYSQGYVYQNDTGNYTTGATGKVSVYSINISQADYNTLLAFGQAGVQLNGTAGSINSGGATFNNHYNGLDNSCVDFTWTALSTIGITPSFHVYGSRLAPSENESVVPDALTTYGTKPSSFLKNLYDGLGNLLSVKLTDASGNTLDTSTFSLGDGTNETITTTNSSGAVIGTATETFNSASNTYTDDIKGIANGSTQNEQTLTLGAFEANSASVTGNGAQVALQNGNVNFASGATATLMGGGDTVKLSSNDNVSIDTGLHGGSISYSPSAFSAVDNVSASGTGNLLTTANSGSFNVNTTGINANFGAGVSLGLSGNGSATEHNGTFDPNFMGPVLPSTYIADGSALSLYGSGTLSANYASLSFGSGASFDLWGNNDKTYGSTSDYIDFRGLQNTFTGSGAQLVEDTGTGLTTIGTDTVTLNGSNVSLNGPNDSVVDNLSGLTDINLSGTNISVTGSGSGGSFLDYGTNINNYTNGSFTDYFGSMTGNNNYGSGSSWYDYSNPDFSYVPPVFSFTDPVVLNLAGAKVQTQNLTASSAYFDVQDIGVKDHTGWGTAGEGYLVYDPASTNTVVNEASLIANFAALQHLDTNHDNILSALDTTWASLKVWVDSAGNASFAAGSLKTMDQIGIASININATHVNQNQNNNTILDDSTFTWKTGGTGDIAGVDFNYHAASVVTAPAPAPAPSPRPPACVHIDSRLPDGRRAGDVRVGDDMVLADEKSLEAGTGIVTYSKQETVPGYRIITESGVALVCSDTAPIPTPDGLVKAPNLLGLKVPVRRDEGGGFLKGWEKVVHVEAVGDIDVQYITVGDKCFWAGEKAAAFILHHNITKQVP